MCITSKIYKNGLSVTSGTYRMQIIIVYFEKMWENIAEYRDKTPDLSPAAENKFHN